MASTWSYKRDRNFQLDFDNGHWTTKTDASGAYDPYGVEERHSGSDCGNEGVATFNIWGGGFAATIKSTPGCRFVSKSYKGAGVGLEFDVYKGERYALIYLTGNRRVRRTLNWTMHLTSPAGWKEVDPQLACIHEFGRPGDWGPDGTQNDTWVDLGCDPYEPLQTLGEYVALPYPGSDYKQSGKVILTRKHHASVKARRYWGPLPNPGHWGNGPWCKSPFIRVGPATNFGYCFTRLAKPGYWTTTISHWENFIPR